MEIPESIIKTLEEMKETSWTCYKEFKKDRKHAMANRFFGEYNAYDSALRMISEPDFAKRMAEIFLETNAEHQVLP